MGWTPATAKTTVMVYNTNKCKNQNSSHCDINNQSYQTWFTTKHADHSCLHEEHWARAGRWRCAQWTANNDVGISSWQGVSQKSNNNSSIPNANQVPCEPVWKLMLLLSGLFMVLCKIRLACNLGIANMQNACRNNILQVSAIYTIETMWFCAASGVVCKFGARFGQKPSQIFTEGAIDVVWQNSWMMFLFLFLFAQFAWISRNLQIW